MPNDCLFCKIVEKEVPSYVVYEDDHYVAFLDIVPFVRGQTIVVVKEHKDSRVFKNSDNDIKDIVIVAKRVAAKLESAIKPERVCLVFEGKGVNHLHAKLYPVMKTGEDEPGKEYITPRGKEASPGELAAVQKRILSA